MVIFLVGFMGAGKTSIAQLVAREYGYIYIDTDEEIEKKYGQTISTLFQTKGEATFRQIEADILRSLILTPNTIIATGGGLPCYHSNMQWMNQVGITIYIKQEAAELEKRLVDTWQHRPLLNKIEKNGLLGYINDLLEVRKPYYEQAKFAILGTLVSAQTVINTAIL